ncbi:Wings apart-like protein regulation of heterochromatin [Pelomyxa schiedti]|nr:Wings apart-like protein regulation of heterochromatin [Pelomyxa schiedti]
MKVSRKRLPLCPIRPNVKETKQEDPLLNVEVKSKKNRRKNETSNIDKNRGSNVTQIFSARDANGGSASIPPSTKSTPNSTPILPTPASPIKPRSPLTLRRRSTSLHQSQQPVVPLETDKPRSIEIQDTQPPVSDVKVVPTTETLPRSIENSGVSSSTLPPQQVNLSNQLLDTSKEKPFSLPVGSNPVLSTASSLSPTSPSRRRVYNRFGHTVISPVSLQHIPTPTTPTKGQHESPTLSPATPPKGTPTVPSQAPTLLSSPQKKDVESTENQSPTPTTPLRPHSASAGLDRGSPLRRRLSESDLLATPPRRLPFTPKDKSPFCLEDPTTKNAHKEKPSSQKSKRPRITRTLSRVRRRSSYGSEFEEIDESASSLGTSEQQKNFHLLDEISYLLDGIEMERLSACRASCCNFVKLCKHSTNDVGLVLRAHGLFEKIFTSIDHKAAGDEVMSLCAVSALYFLLGDPANLSYANGDCLALVIKVVKQLLLLGSLNKTSPTPTNPLHVGSPPLSPPKKRKNWLLSCACADSPLKPVTAGVYEQISQVQQLFSNLPHNFEEITAGVVGLECLQLITSSQKNHSVNDECRKCGALEVILSVLKGYKTTLKSSSDRWTNRSFLWQVENCLKIVENVTFLNSENQQVLVREGAVEILLSVLDDSKSRVQTITIAILKALINLTEGNETAASPFYGNPQSLDLVSGLLSLQYPPNCNTHDIRVLTLGLLINLAEGNPHIREATIKTKVGQKPLMPSIVDIFLENCTTTSSEEIPQENRVLASYAALLVGCLVQQHPKNCSLALEALPTHSFTHLTAFLREFVEWQDKTGILTHKAKLSCTEVLKVLTDASATATTASSQPTDNEPIITSTTSTGVNSQQEQKLAAPRKS